MGITELEGRVLLEHDMLKATEQYHNLIKGGTIEKHMELDENVPRTFVLIEMIFNMGLGTFLKFKNLIEAVNDENWERASANMLDTKWATQVGQRAKTLAKVMLTNKHDGESKYE